MDYQLFAVAVSVVAVLVSGVALWFTFRRALRWRLTVWVRRMEGPVMTAVFLIAVATLASALSIGTPDYATIARIAMNTIRGLVVGVSLIVIGQYWVAGEIRWPR